MIVNKVKLEKLFKEFISSCVFEDGKKELHSFVDSLPSDIFVKQGSGYLIEIVPKREDVEAFKSFMISSGFGDEASFNAVCSWSAESGSFTFDPTKSPICEFIISSGLSRRYNIALDTIPLTSGFKRIVLGDPVLARRIVTFSFSVTLRSDIFAEDNRSAVYATYERYAKSPLSVVLGVKDERVKNIKLVRPGNIVATRVDNLRFDVDYPIFGEAVVSVSSASSSEYDMYLEACKIFRDACNSELRLDWIKFDKKSCIPE